MSIQTIKLPHKIENFEVVLRLQKAQNNVINLAYNRLADGLKEREIREIREYLKTCKLDDFADSWISQCGIKKAMMMYTAHCAVREDENASEPIFGGLKLWKSYISGKISKTQWKLDKLFPVVVQGEAPKHGNRKFNLDFENNQITFKISKSNHIVINLPKIAPNQMKLLVNMQKSAQINEIAYQIQIDKDFVYISFEQPVKPVKNLKNMTAGVDLNPNYLGLVICKGDKLIHQQIFDMTSLNKCGNTNKIKYEKTQVAKQIHKLFQHYQVSSLFLEDLNIKNKNHNKGKTFNRLVNNQWYRYLLL